MKERWDEEAIIPSSSGLVQADKTADDICWQKLKVGQGPPYLGPTILRRIVGWASAHLQGLKTFRQDLTDSIDSERLARQGVLV